MSLVLMKDKRNVGYSEQCSNNNSIFDILASKDDVATITL